MPGYRCLCRGGEGRRPPDQMKRAMARQAEAERERRAKVIAAQGEFQASETLAQAARQLPTEPTALQLRYLQTAPRSPPRTTRPPSSPIPIELFAIPDLGLSRGDEDRGIGEQAGPALPAATFIADFPSSDCSGGTGIPHRSSMSEGHPLVSIARTRADHPACGPNCRPPSGKSATA